MHLQNGFPIFFLAHNVGQVDLTPCPSLQVERRIHVRIVCFSTCIFNNYRLALHYAHFYTFFALRLADAIPTLLQLKNKFGEKVHPQHLFTVDENVLQEEIRLINR